MTKAESEKSATPAIAAIIWDVDGTIADTIPLCVSGLRVAIVEHGGPELSDQQVVERFGPTEEGVLQNEVGDRWPEAIERYLELYRQGHSGGDVGFEGVSELIVELAEDGVPMAVVTGKGERSAEITIEALGLGGVFTEVAAGSMSGPIKEHEIRRIVNGWGLPPASVAYVGDMPSDVDASTAAGVVPLIALWNGSMDRGGFPSVHPAQIFDEAEALREWLADRLVRPNADR